MGHRALFDRLLTDVLASLMHKGLLRLDLVAQDGTRVRASASAPSLRRYESLLECRQQAALHLTSTRGGMRSGPLLLMNSTISTASGRSMNERRGPTTGRYLTQVHAIPEKLQSR